MIKGLLPAIESILAAGNQAPSGENAQPWRFLVRGMHIEVHCIPERDTSYYNWGQCAAYMSIGAVIENMVIAATSLGYKSQVDLFPPGEATHVATVSLELHPASAHDLLAAAILLRTTNRKRYLATRLSEREKKALQESIGSDKVQLHITDERSDVARLAAVGAANEEIMLSNEMLHAFFFSHITWTKEEDAAKKTGFFIKTLELPGAAVLSFLILRNWFVMQQLLRVGFEKFIGRQNALTYASSAAIGAISMATEEPQDFVNAGRAMERLWLTATQMGMSLQPLTGIFFFKLQLDKDESALFSWEQKKRIHDEYAAAQKIFGIADRRIVFMFRIGSGSPPTARSSRFPLDQIVTVLP